MIMRFTTKVVRIKDGESKHTCNKTAKTVKIAKNRNKQGGNHKRCPVCGKFMGSGKHG